MKLKPVTENVRRIEAFKKHIRGAHENLRPLIDEIEGKFFQKIKKWSPKDSKKLYDDYSLYLLMEDMLYAIEKAAHRLQ